MKEWDLPVLQEFIDATPSAELIPLGERVQSDEEEMGASPGAGYVTGAVVPVDGGLGMGH